MEREEIKPAVGMGVTQVIGSDRYPGTISRVSASGKTFWFKRDNYKRTDRNGISESQTYEYSADPNCYETEVRRRKDGSWQEIGGGYVNVGFRRAYLDPSF